MTRRTLLWSPLMLGARRAMNLLPKAWVPAWAAKGASEVPAGGEVAGLATAKFQSSAEV